MRSLGFAKLHGDEDGHTAPLVVVGAGLGAALLSAGAAAGEDVLTIVGGVVLTVGLIAGSMLTHTRMDYEVYDRLNKLEGGGGSD